MYHRKGQIGGAVGAIIALIVGVGVAVLVLIFVGVLGGQSYNIAEDDISSIGNNSVVNESFTPLTNETTQLAHHNIHSGSLAILNASTGTSLPVANFSVDYAAGTLILDHANPANATPMLATYNWGQIAVQTNVDNAVTSGFEALENTGDYLPLIVLAVVIALVLSLVLGFTGLGGGMGRGSAL